MIKICDLLEGKDFTTAGSILYDLIRGDINSSGKIIINMEGVSSLPSMFWNVSISRIIEEFGLEVFKSKVSFVNITKMQAKRLTEHVNQAEG